AGSRAAAASTGRDLPTAVIVGVVLGALFVGAILWRPAAVLALVVAILAVAAYEYFAKITEKGYRPVVAAGIAACVAGPLAAYWLGDGTLPLVVAFAFMAGAVSFVGATSIESGPLPNMAVTTMGVVWIGLLGSYAALILKFSTGPGGSDIGTDTMVLLVLGVVANDVGALFVGSATGRTVLRSWISPNKSLEGLIGGTVMTIVALLVVGIADLSDTWNDIGELVILAAVIAVMAPLGDLTESMFKRNLDVKDFGAVVKGHGGMLDRFDSFLFVLPAVYYLMLVLEPWAS
ncbi:MAG: phosphatidate cytidylyltransferase, partial [Actinomycetota bacterium]|nr:phosphatidate cytidylyltransferase [Actinomycetota bacterium]